MSRLSGDHDIVLFLRQLDRLMHLNLRSFATKTADLEYIKRCLSVSRCLVGVCTTGVCLYQEVSVLYLDVIESPNVAFLMRGFFFTLPPLKAEMIRDLVPPPPQSLAVSLAVSAVSTPVMSTHCEMKLPDNSSGERIRFSIPR
ncbi:hypothetical protein CEXT_262531 [Caerostris extrusa]|uniref:Uncharacterized protein n=1 Tax=Caerostris extrusa TaxID=172846 RepID=A0AAV4R3L5_CAEEX|nr:hypothetical protein CEXT_262531 [Caerostris extrusa]